MLIKAKTLKGYKLDSLDGEIGQVNEFYFNDQHWTVRSAGIMDIRCIGLTHTHGDIIPTSCVIVKNGKKPPWLRKRRDIPICAARTM